MGKGGAGDRRADVPWGNEWDVAKCVSSVGTCSSSTAPVGSIPAGASPYGALDMAGNVWEWCADWDGPYTAAPAKNPTGPASGTFRVLRGGSWNYTGASNFRCAYRNWGDPSGGYNYVGFRCVVLSPGP